MPTSLSSLVQCCPTYCLVLSPPFLCLLVLQFSLRSITAEFTRKNVAESKNRLETPCAARRGTWMPNICRTEVLFAIPTGQTAQPLCEAPHTHPRPLLPASKKVHSTFLAPLPPQLVPLLVVLELEAKEIFGTLTLPLIYSSTFCTRSLSRQIFVLQSIHVSTAIPE